MRKRICIVHGGSPRAWHAWLADALSKNGENDVVFRASSQGVALPSALQLLLLLEKTIYRVAGECAVANAKAEDIDKYRCAEQPAAGSIFDVVIALNGRAPDLPQGRRTFIPIFDTQPSEYGALSAILEERELRFGVVELGGEGRSAFYLAAAEAPAIFATTLNAVCGRIVDLFALMLEGSEVPRLGAAYFTPSQVQHGTGADWHTLAAHSMGVVAERLRRRLSAALCGGERWAIGYRDTAGASAVSVSIGARRYSLLPDDGRRCFADPFPFNYGGSSYIFCEEWPYASRKGVISVFELRAGRLHGSARPVLEERHHLSYPTVFQDEGQIWMIPEGGAGGGIDLYRATQFPGGWVREARLLDGITAYDPTLYRDAQGYWLFFTSSGRYGSPSDRLSLYRADTLRGPWRPCGDQPVAIDPKSARPAGNLFSQGHKLYRPSQDCSKLYGGAIVFNEITKLTDAGFDEVPVARFSPPASGPLQGAHTFNRCGTLETVDVFGWGFGTEADLEFCPVSRTQPVSVPALKLLEVGAC